MADKYVSKSGNDGNSGDDWDNSYLTIQVAVTALAATGGTIYIATGKYDEDVTVTTGTTIWYFIGVGHVIWTATNTCFHATQDGGGRRPDFYFTDITFEDTVNGLEFDYPSEGQCSLYIWCCVFRNFSGEAIDFYSRYGYYYGFSEVHHNIFDNCDTALLFYWSYAGIANFYDNLFLNCDKAWAHSTEVNSQEIGHYKGGGQDFYFKNNICIDCGKVFYFPAMTDNEWRIENTYLNFNRNVYVNNTAILETQGSTITTLAALIAYYTTEQETESIETTDVQLIDKNTCLYYLRHGTQSLSVGGIHVGPKPLGVGWSSNVNADDWEDWIDEDWERPVDGVSSFFEYINSGYSLISGVQEARLFSPVVDIGSVTYAGQFVERANFVIEDEFPTDVIDEDNLIDPGYYNRKRFAWRGSNTEFTQPGVSPPWISGSSGPEFICNSEGEIDSSYRYLQFSLFFTTQGNF